MKGGLPSVDFKKTPQMNKKLMTYIALLLLGMSSYSCKKETTNESVAKPNAKAIAATAYNDSKNPYSLASMRKAMASLLMKDVQLMANNKLQYSHGKIMAVGGSAALTINKTLTTKESVTLVNNEMSATHYYIKFLPKDEKDLALLKVDSNLVVYPFPLHTNSNQYGGNYRDPAVPAGVPTYQYASVPVSYVLPNVPFVKLADLYLPDERSNAKPVTIKGADNSSYSVSGRALVGESLCDEEPVTDDMLDIPYDECDGNYGGGGPSTGTGAPPGEWRPSGRITMTDDVLGLIGVEGIKVRARRWFTTYTGLTDANGDYHVDGTYTRPANYWLDFERYDYAIVDVVHDATYEVSGPKQQAAWNVNFTGFERFCATIFRAAFHYYHKDIQGLHRPPQNSLWAAKLHIRPSPGATSSSTGRMDFISWHLGELILIEGLLASSTETYSTTIHELAHAAHWDNSNLSLNLSAKSARESWAQGVEWALTKMVYPNYQGVYRSPGIGTEYRNIVIDLIDDSSQISYFERGLYNGFYHNFGLDSSKDQVHGYNIVDIQNALINGPNTWNDWKNNIINNYNNGTEQNVEALFNHWLSY